MQFYHAIYVIERIIFVLFVDNLNNNYMVWKCFICYCLTWDNNVYKNNWSKLLPIITNAEPTRMGGYLWLSYNTSYLLFKHLIQVLFVSLISTYAITNDLFPLLHCFLACEHPIYCIFQLFVGLLMIHNCFLKIQIWIQKPRNWCEYEKSVKFIGYSSFNSVTTIICYISGCF